MAIYLIVNIEELGFIKILNNEFTNHMTHDCDKKT